MQTRDFKEAESLVFGTHNGVIKKSRLADYNTQLKADGIIAINLRDGDDLSRPHSSGEDDVIMVSRSGQAVRFQESAVRPTGRATAGVTGMRFRGDDEVIEIAIATDDADLLVVTENGYGKRTPIRDYRLTGRGTLGVKTVKLTEERGQLAGARVVRDGFAVMLISTGGTVIRMPVEDVSAWALDPGRHRHAPAGR